MKLKVIAYARNGHTDKFGIPRQSREESPILTRIVFEPEFVVREALRGIEGYSHLWLIWGFSETSRSRDVEMSKEEQSDQVESQTSKVESCWSPTVRPPRLGGNKRMGVFATRSPFRPNPIGLSSVRLIAIVENGKLIQSGTSEYRNPGFPTEKGTLELIVSGADLLDGTPIYDIKPYLSFSDSHEDAKNGFAEETKDYRLTVNWTDGCLTSVEEPTNHPLITHLSSTPTCKKDRILREIEYILSQDPRPGYQDDPEREYKLDYAGYTVTFVVKYPNVFVKKIEKMQIIQ
jgi:tRNA-Thr(GGU) m(6)t(6)A37 methyltransferase TsaA